MPPAQRLRLRLLVSGDHVVVRAEIGTVEDPGVEVKNTCCFDSKVRIAREDPRPVSISTCVAHVRNVSGFTPTRGPIRCTAAFNDNRASSFCASRTRRTARSRNSAGYFLGAGITPPFRGIKAPTKPVAIQPLHLHPDGLQHRGSEVHRRRVRCTARYWSSGPTGTTSGMDRRRDGRPGQLGEPAPSPSRPRAVGRLVNAYQHRRNPDVHPRHRTDHAIQIRGSTRTAA